MLREFTAPMAINQAKIGDTLLFEIEEETGCDFWLTVYDLEGSRIWGPSLSDYERDGVLYFELAFSSSNGFAARSYYEIVVSDVDLTGSFAEKTWIVYVNSDASMESVLDRALGLAGGNHRSFGYVWANGQLSSYKVRTYLTAANLALALNGGADNYLAEYEISFSYDNGYNRISMTSVKQ